MRRMQYEDSCLIFFSCPVSNARDDLHDEHRGNQDTGEGERYNVECIEHVGLSLRILAFPGGGEHAVHDDEEDGPNPPRVPNEGPNFVTHGC